MLPKVGIHRKNQISIERILADLHANPDLRKAGAILSFIGIVRGETHDGDKVDYLQYEAYEEKAVGVMETIRAETLRKDGIIDVHIHHIVDTVNLEIGDEVLYVVVAGKSRKNVFDVLRETVERVKSEVPIYKKERLTEGSSYWVAEDFNRRGRITSKTVV